MKANLQDCFDQVASLNKRFNLSLAIKGGNRNWGLYTKIEKGLLDISIGLSIKELSSFLDGIRWAFTGTINKRRT